MTRKRDRLTPMVPVEEMPPVRMLTSTVPEITEGTGGGLPVGLSEMYGLFSGGKTTISLSFLPHLYVDVERGLDPSWVMKFAPGVLVARPATLEEAFNLIESVLPSSPRLIVLDSLGGGLSEKELEGEQQARLSAVTSRWLRRLVPQLEDTALLIVNQVRATLNAWGPQTTTPGGHVLHHLALKRIEVRRLGYVEVGEKKIGQQILVRVVKNKVGPPFSERAVWLGWNGQFYPTEEQLKAERRA